MVFKTSRDSSTVSHANLETVTVEFVNMNNMLVLEAFHSKKTPLFQENIGECTLETLISLCVHKFCNLSNFPIKFTDETVCTGNNILFNLNDLKENILTTDLPWQVASCKLPTVFADSTIVTGLCAVSRYLCKCRTSNPLEIEHPKGILGFRNGCLQAPNEVSVWTKFCEIEIVETTKLLIENSRKTFSSSVSFEIPTNMARFEKHLNQPLRVHNVYKVAREAANKSYKTQEAVLRNTKDEESSKQVTPKKNVKYRNWKSKNKPIYIDSSTPINDLNLEHLFAEGPYLTLADIILYPCYYSIFSILDCEKLQPYLPKTLKWFKNIASIEEFKGLDVLLSEAFDSLMNANKFRKDIIYSMPDVKDVSLYKCDPKRSNPKKRLFTKEVDVESALSLVAEQQNLLLSLSKSVLETDLKIDWTSVPPDANPNGGHLPDKRMERKTQQLENVAIAVMKMALDGNRIVDFCCGSGHLGILLAYLLPKCTIVLLENKEESLNRAKTRVNNLGLKNIYFFQCNLDYFVGSFDIGVALHACGTATDLVLENCVKKNASFVVCPCCYGSLHVTERLKYPRSEDFSIIPLDKYMCIGHAADQTHVDHPMEERGAKCMTIIDSDRARHAMNNGYTVELSRLKPLSCTPKNMLIVGISGK